MKKLCIYLLFYSAIHANAQSPRLSLMEIFTGENCGSCVSCNHYLDTFLVRPSISSKVVPIRWMIPVPSAPSHTWSLYQSYKSDIDWRSGGASASGYGYPSYFDYYYLTSSAPTTTANGSGIVTAPHHFFDGDFFSGYYFNVTDAFVTTVSSYSSAFSINISPAWNANYTAFTVTVNIQATANFTAAGVNSLFYRLVMIEKTIDFDTAPGSNGEKHFENVVIKSFPTTTSGSLTTSMGSLIPSSWVNGQTLTFTLNCALPPTVHDLAQLAFVGFIQDDATYSVEQTTYTNAPGVSNDAAASAININDVVCSATFVPIATIKNSGSNSITAFTVTPTLDGVSSANVIWSGNLAAGASTTIPLNLITLSQGTHTYSYNINSVSGGEYNYGNNKLKTVKFARKANSLYNSVTEPFTATTFPPTDWIVIKRDSSSTSWSRIATVGAYGINTGAAKYDFFHDLSANGNIGDLYLKPQSFAAMNLPVLSFDVAYAQVPLAPYDSPISPGNKLEVMVSTDCGATWGTVFSQAGSVLATAPTSTTNSSEFVPTASQWKTVTLLLNSYANAPEVLVKFVAYTDVGNSLYLDNVNLFNLGQPNPTSIKTDETNDMTLDIFPNPAEKELNVTLTTMLANEANLTIINALGQTVYTRKLDVSNGTSAHQISVKDLSNGIYTVLVNAVNSSVTRKIIIAK